MTFTTAWAKDAAERVVRAFFAAFVGQLVLAGANVFNQSTLHAAEAAGLASCLSVVLSLLGATQGGTVSPASLAATPRHRRDAGFTEGRVPLALTIIVIALLLGLVVNHWLFFLALIALIVVV